MTNGVEYQARPHDELIRELLDSGIPKSEREHAAAREIEALRAEVERLRADLMESDELREKLGHLLTLTTKALKGEPPEGVWHSWHDLPEKAAQLMESLRKLEEQAQRDEALLRQALNALEILRTGLIQMREHAQSYGEAWARAYVKEYRGLLPGSAKEHFRALNAMHHRLADVANGVIKGFDAIAALRERCGLDAS